ncbi:regulator of polyketide synthase expression [Sporosarcina sp. BI001-red]|uniref:PucR family transcriptional regulator n=1 Tax=Sporosarcina sp. BI001-red TaxID=2282866 RepID=UPI000E25133A|nr:helix-turn-helix domain-containing protein [Sporosarcina sp. BI001-red]REB10111.1 regulator of polyketide synthase expression [Sporosarcina sp. BI001-red]
MINQLRKIYPSIIRYEEKNNHLDHSYKWFISHDDEIIGIREDELTVKEQSVLTAFMVPYNVNFPIPTVEEKKWSSIIHSRDLAAKSNFKITIPFRFVYFSIKKNEIDPVVFKSAIQELFSRNVPVLWVNGYEGIIIEELSEFEEGTSYEQIIDILMSDLYVKIKFFVGPYRKNEERIMDHYHAVLTAAREVFFNTNRVVITYMDAIPYLLVHQTDDAFCSEMSDTVLQEYKNDEETLKMIEVFLKSNLNLSETSKILHMHRNSLQYRLDRFFENTGIDIRQFHQAMTVYLALLARK